MDAITKPSSRIVMEEFRKKLHVEYKNKLVTILMLYITNLSDESEIFLKDPRQYTVDWVNKHCSPMGDFDKEQAIKEIEEWDK